MTAHLIDERLKQGEGTRRLLLAEPDDEQLKLLSCCHGLYFTVLYCFLVMTSTTRASRRRHCPAVHESWSTGQEAASVWMTTC
jgi:hypothetical protein